MKIQGNSNVYTNYKNYQRKEVERKEPVKKQSSDILEITNKNYQVDKEKVNINYVSKNLAQQMTQDTKQEKLQEIKSKVANSTYIMEDENLVLKIIIP